MKLAIKIDRSEYSPISFGPDHLYNQYDKIQSFLVSEFKDKYKNILAKPVLSGNDIHWYTNTEKNLYRLSDLPDSIKQNILERYWNIKESIKNDIDKLKESKDIKDKEWAEILNSVFDDDNNIIVTDEVNWRILWGWEFKNKDENYLHPDYRKPDILKGGDEEGPGEIINEEVEEPGEDGIITDPSPGPQPPTPPPPPPPPTSSFWQRLKHILRNFVFHYWGLLLLIMLILLILCLVNCCIRHACTNMDELQQRIDQIEQKAKEKCAEQ